METKEFNQNSGQAIVEYMLLLSMLLTLSFAIYTGVSATRDKTWKRILCVVSAACPECKATESAKNALPAAGVRCAN